MFKDLQAGYPVMMLDKSEGVLKYITGTVVSRGEPRFNDKAKPQPGIPQLTLDKVVDLTVEYSGQTNTFVVPENGSIASSPQLTLACDSAILSNEVRASLKKSEEIIASVDAHKANIEACNDILAQLNPSFAESREQNKRIENLENSIDDIKGMLGQIMNRMPAPTSNNKKQKNELE